jgi:signal transduction histidine kinase
VIHSSFPIQLDSMDSPLVQAGIPEVHSMIAEPLEGEEQQALGALALINKRGGPFTAEDLGLLRLVSANLSTAVRLFNTKQVRAKEERLSSIGRLLSQVVHDLKSPLTVISGYVQLMEESSERAARQLYASEILKQFKALGAMEREVLAFARGETQDFARRVIMDRLLADVGEQMRPELAEKGVQLKISAMPKLIGHLDSERITRALQNLIRNAAEAMAPLGGGIVRVRADAEGETLTLRVSDTGPGIPASIAPRLFQSFVTAGKAQGTGLGLAIVKRIVEEHGGSVQVAQVPRGACFLMTLPGAVVVPGAASVESESVVGHDMPTKEVVRPASTKKRSAAPKSAAPKSAAPKSAAKRAQVKKVGAGFIV